MLEKFRLGMIVAAFVLVFGIGGAAAQNYGAIAFSPSTGATGWSYDYGSRSAAESTALANCRQNAPDCIVPIWFRDACGALAVGNDNGYGTGWGTTRDIAESLALNVCRKHATGCEIRRWVCTTIENDSR
jgi:serine/threonine-protein kinase